MKSLSLQDGKGSKKICSGDEKLETLPGPLFEMSMSGHSYNIYNAAQAVARALHMMYEESISKYRSRVAGGRSAAWNLHPWEVIAQQNTDFHSCLNSNIRTHTFIIMYSLYYWSAFKKPFYRVLIMVLFYVQVR